MTKSAESRRVLFLMHIDWRWIWQRPHEFATGLAIAGYDVLVLYIPSFHRRRLSPASVHHRRVRAFLLPTLPLRRFRLARLLTRLLHRLSILAVVKTWHPHVMWLTSPLLEPALPRSGVRDAVVIYDCMDVATAFDWPAREASEIRIAEQRLVAESDLILASSQYIADNILCEYGRKAVLVRNGYRPTSGEIPEAHMATPGSIRMLYVGTISRWFDFETVGRVLDALPRSRLTLVGPAEVNVPTHPRMTHIGPRPHAELAGIAAAHDVLVMPFDTSHRVVLGVDPVKLYEYLAWNKPVVATRYPEIERFGSYVTLCDSGDEFAAAVRQAPTRNVAAARSKVCAFLAENTWQARIVQVTEMLRAFEQRPTQRR